MKRVIGFVSITTVMIAGTVYTASASVLPPLSEDVVTSVASGNLKITYLGTDAMGADTYRNRNAEYVQFENTTKEVVSIAGVTIEDAWAHDNLDSNCNSFTVKSTNVDSSMVPTGTDEVDLQPGESVRVYTGWGTPKVSRFDAKVHLAFMDSKRWCGTNGHYLNNQRETVYLTDAKGKAVSSVNYDFEWGYDFKVA